MTARPPPTLGDLVHVVWQRRLLACAVAGVISVAGLAWVSTRAPQYEATARLVVGENRKTVDFQRSSDGLREFALVNTYRELLLSPGVLRAAIDAAGAAGQEPFAGADDPGEILGRMVRVLVNRDSWVLTVACKHPDPARAEQLLTGLVEGFLARLRTSQRGNGAESVRFLQDQLTAERLRLAEANKREQEFRKLTGVISNDPRENHAYVRMQDLQRQRVDLDRKLTEAQALAEQVATALRLAEAERTEGLLRIPGIASGPGVADSQESLRQLRERLAQAGDKYLAKHPRILELNAQIADRQKTLTLAVNEAAARCQAERDRLQTESGDLDTRLVEAENAARMYRDNLSRLGVLEQDTRSREEVVRHLTARAAELEVTANLDELQVAMVDQPHAGTKPVGLPRSLLAILAVVGAGLVGALVSVVVDLLDRRLRGGDMLRRLTGDRPLLATLPVAAELVAPGTAGPRFDEEIRTLRTNLKFIAGARNSLVVAVLPSAPGVGAATVAANVAVAFAAAGERTLLVDGDLRRPQIETLLGLQGGPGFTLLLAGEPGIAPVGTPWPNLHLLGAGPVPPNSAELLNSHCLPEWLEQVRQRYPVIVFAASDLAGASDALVLADHADVLVLVARDVVTTTTQVADAVTRLTPVQAKLGGSVLTIGAPTA